MQTIIPDSPVIVALDYQDASTALEFVDSISPQQCRVKVGKVLFTRCGSSLIQSLHQRGFQVFLDLKFHDIPNTVADAITAAAELGVWMVNVHASGGVRMMQAARQALLPFGHQAPLLIAVTVLTSTQQGELAEMGISMPLEHYAQLLALRAQQCGFDGVVCSAWEAVKFKQAFGQGFKLVTPGIRTQDSKTEDQRRVMTPQQAQQAGVDYMVIGRPITRAANPAQRLAAICADLRQAGQ